MNLARVGDRDTSWPITDAIQPVNGRAELCLNSYLCDEPRNSICQRTVIQINRSLLLVNYNLLLKSTISKGWNSVVTACTAHISSFTYMNFHEKFYFLEKA